MPFDALGTEVLPLDSPERWSTVVGAVTRPRAGFKALDDNFALYIIGEFLKARWARRLNDGDNHCIVGWVVHQCEPMTTFELGRMSEQSKRILKRLHDALPKSAQRSSVAHEYTLARYNDTHTHKTMVRLCKRAYEMYINEMWRRIDAGVAR